MTTPTTPGPDQQYNPGGPIWPPQPVQLGPGEIVTPPPKKRSVLGSRWLPWSLAGVLALTLAGVLVAPYVGAGDPSSPTGATAQKAWARDSALRAARASCDSASAGTRLADDDRTLIVNTAGEEDTSGISVTQLGCITKSLKMPESVVAELESTRALDGKQEATWDDYSATWTYHPDAGLDVIITEK